MSDEEERLEREARVARMLHAAAQTERAPSSLRDEVVAMRAHAATRRRARRRRARLGLTRPGLTRPGLTRPVLGFVSLGMPAVVAVVVALALTLGGGAGTPSIAQAMALAARGPAASAPGPARNAPAALLDARVGDLQFPNWKSAGGWRSVGQREDSLGNRTVRTVFYAADGRRIAYSIVSAPALAGLNTHGEPYAAMSRRGRTVIVWEERNHTCVLSGSGVGAQQLWALVQRT